MVNNEGTLAVTGWRAIRYDKSTPGVPISFLSHLISQPMTLPHARVPYRAIPLRTCPVTDTNKRIVTPPILPLSFTCALACPIQLA